MLSYWVVIHLFEGINESLELLKPNAYQKEIRLQNNTPQGIHVKADSLMLRSIVQNLVTNAIKYTPQGGKIVVGCRRTKDAIRIQVHDTGIGISHENLSKIFEAFRRVDPAGSEGLGLGLFIVRHAAESLGPSEFRASEDREQRAGDKGQKARG